jgi:type I restriction enzyme S subunit
MIKATNFIKTGIPWTPYAPIGWDIKRGKFVFKSIKEINSQMQCKDRLALTLKGVIDRYEGDNIGLNPSDLRTYQIFKPNELVFKLLDLDNKKTSRVGYVHKQGIMSSAYIRVLNNPEMNMRYFYYQYYDLYQRYIFNFIGQGVRATMSASDLLNIPILIPPLETQNAIVAYLDRKTQQIQEFIAKKERLIELLEEEKQSIINKSVIQGIDKNIKFKETDLGLIPVHWEIKRLGTLGRFYKGGNISREELTTLFVSDDDVSAILYGDIYTKYNIEVTTVINKVSKITAIKSVKLNKGDLLFTGSGETKEDIGKCVLFNSDLETFAGGDVIIFKQRHVDGLFLSYSQNSNLAKYQRYLSSKGEIIIHTYGSLLRNVYMPFPPSIEEQKQIATYIKNECLKIDNAIFKANSEIEKAKEYQESLITQIVTGQLKVPENVNLEQSIELGMVAESNGVYHSKH